MLLHYDELLRMCQYAFGMTNVEGRRAKGMGQRKVFYLFYKKIEPLNSEPLNPEILH